MLSRSPQRKNWPTLFAPIIEIIRALIREIPSVARGSKMNYSVIGVSRDQRQWRATRGTVPYRRGHRSMCLSRRICLYQGQRRRRLLFRRTRVHLKQCRLRTRPVRPRFLIACSPLAFPARFTIVIEIGYLKL